jgi:hypothetical protein
MGSNGKYPHAAEVGSENHTLPPAATKKKKKKKTLKPPQKKKEGRTNNPRNAQPRAIRGRDGHVLHRNGLTSYGPLPSLAAKPPLATNIAMG